MTQTDPSDRFNNQPNSTTATARITGSKQFTAAPHGIQEQLHKNLCDPNAAAVKSHCFPKGKANRISVDRHRAVCIVAGVIQKLADAFDRTFVIAMGKAGPRKHGAARSENDKSLWAALEEASS